MRFRRERAARRGALVPQPTTHVQFSGEELVAVARFLAAGRVMLQEEYPPVVARLKAALTRLKFTPLKGF